MENQGLDVQKFASSKNTLTRLTINECHAEAFIWGGKVAFALGAMGRGGAKIESATSLFNVLMCI